MDTLSPWMKYLKRAADEWAYLPDERVPLHEVYVLLEAVPRPARQPRTRQGPEDLAPEEPRLDAAGRDIQPWVPPDRARPSERVREKPEPPPSPIPLLEALGLGPHLVLLGEPGAGKTVSLRYLALRMARAALGDAQARQEFPADEPLRIPVLLHAREVVPFLPESLPLERAVRRSVQNWSGTPEVNLSTVVALRDQGNLAVLVDGLDEVPEDQRSRLHGELRRFARVGERTRLVVASRPAGYTSLAPAFQEFHLRPLTDPETVVRFLARWMQVLGAPDPQERARRLWEVLQRQPGLRRLAVTPLLLRMLAVTEAESPGRVSRLRDRAALYAEYLTALWKRARKRWQQEQGRPLPDELRATADAALEAWAWARHSRGRRTLQELRRTLEEAGRVTGETDWETLWELLRRTLGLLARVGEEVLFTHLTWQEYLVARRLARAWEAHRGEAWNFIRAHLHLPEWQEVWRLLARMLPPHQARNLVGRVARARSFAEKSLHRDLRLAVMLAALVEDAPFLRRSLRHRRAAVRRAVLEGIARAGLEGATEPVLQALTQAALRDENRRVRRAAARALKAMGEAAATEPVLQALAQALRDEVWRVRQAAAEVLEAMGAAAATEPVLQALRQTLRDENVSVRRAAAWALGAMGEAAATESVLQAFRRALRDEDEDVRRAAAWALGAMGEAAATEPVLQALRRALRDKDEDVRWVAARVLKAMGETAATEPVLQALAQALRDEDWWVREAAARALGAMGEAAATEPVLQALRRALRDKDEDVRWAAAEALGAMGEAAATEPVLQALRRALRDKNEYVRRAAARALGAMGEAAATEPVLQALAQALWDEDKDVCQAAAEALKAMGEAAATEPVLQALTQAALRDENWRVRQAAAEVLKAMGEAAATEPVLQALAQALRDEDVRWAAAEVLKAMGEAAATEPVLQALTQAALRDEDEDVRRAAAGALGAMGEAAATKPVLRALHRALRDERLWVRWAAAEVLEALLVHYETRQAWAWKTRTRLWDPLQPPRTWRTMARELFRHIIAIVRQGITQWLWRGFSAMFSGGAGYALWRASHQWFPHWPAWGHVLLAVVGSLVLLVVLVSSLALLRLHEAQQEDQKKS